VAYSPILTISGNPHAVRDFGIFGNCRSPLIRHGPHSQSSLISFPRPSAAALIRHPRLSVTGAHMLLVFIVCARLSAATFVPLLLCGLKIANTRRNVELFVEYALLVRFAVEVD
jgi:hypothetical protein